VSAPCGADDDIRSVERSACIRRVPLTAAVVRPTGVMRFVGAFSMGVPSADVVKEGR